VLATTFSPHLVVDGSNIATEGRELPSLAQLDEAVQAFMAEFGPQIVTVVVDASFPNRIAQGERKTYEDAVVAGEIITPPAGAVGRGDAFILQIADRAQATILSNDSFQEFHGQYDWLFEPGRLVGGKPVPHVGWVFVDRTPVRGPTSRRAVGLAKQAAAERTTAAPRSRAAKAGDVSKAAKAVKDATKAVAKAARSSKTSKTSRAERAPEAAKAPVKSAAKTGRAAKAAPEAKTGRAAKAAPEAKTAKAAPAVEPIPAPAAKRGGAPAGDPPPGFNEALPFIEFVGAHPVGSQVAGVVEQFSSHGAYVRIDGILCYAPLKYLADPAPRSARQVLRVGENRSFVVVAVEPARRGVDIALPGVSLDDAPVPAPAPVEPPAEPKPSRRARSARKTAETTKPAAPKAKKAAPKKAAPKKEAVAKAAEPKKAAAPKREPRASAAKRLAAQLTRLKKPSSSK
jgi:hypothetical protein